MTTVRDRLLNPLERVDIFTLASRWQSAEVRLQFNGGAELFKDPGTVGRIRGAFGRQLLTGASDEARDGKPCPWDPPCSFGLLFQKQGRMDAAMEFSAPTALSLDCKRRDLIVRMHVFGFALEYLLTAADALTAALLTDRRWSCRESLSLRSRMIEAAPKTTLDTGSVVLEFRSPVALSKACPLERPQSLLTTGLARLSGLARWHDLELMMDRDRWRALVEDCDFTWDCVERPRRWNRGSSRQKKSMPMEGVLGSLHVENMSAEIAAFIVLARYFHLGSDVTFGLGSFDIKPAG